MVASTAKASPEPPGKSGERGKNGTFEAERRNKELELKENRLRRREKHGDSQGKNYRNL